MWSRAPAQGPLPVIRRLLRGSEWRREVLRANLWLVPAVEVVAAVVLFAGTYSLDRAAFAGDFGLPGWVLSGSLTRRGRSSSRSRRPSSPSSSWCPSW